MGQRFLQESSDNDGECGNISYQDGNKQNLVNHNNKDNNNKTGATVKARITDNNSHAMINSNSSTQNEQLMLNFTPDMRHSSLLAIGPQYDFLNTIYEQNARHLASISSQEVFDGKNGKEDSIINNQSCTEKEKNVPSAYLPDHPYQHQTNSKKTNEQMQQCKGELEREHNTETRQSPVNYASLFGNGDHLYHNNKLDGEPKNVFYYYNNNRTPTIATAESRKTNYTKAYTNKESINTTNNWESCEENAKSKIENSRTIQPQWKPVKRTEELRNTKVECNVNKRVNENDKTMHVLPPITRNTCEQLNDSRNSKHQVNSLRTWENVKPKWYKGNIVNRIKKSISHAESNNVHTANNAKRSNGNKNNNFTVNNNHLPQSNGAMVHKNNNMHINNMSSSKSKNEKLEQFSKKDNDTNEYDYSLQTAYKENSMIEYAAQVELEQEREERCKRIKQIDRIMRGELPDDHNENNSVKNVTPVKEQKNSCNNTCDGSNPTTRCIALQSHENELHSSTNVNDKVQINKTAEEEQLQAMMSALFGKNTHKTDKPISLCNNNIDNNKEHKQTSESKQLVSREQQQQEEHEEQSQSSEEESSNNYISVDDEVSCFCSENKKNDVNKQYQPAISLKTHTSYLLPDLECALSSFAEDDNIYRDKADDHTNRANDTHELEFVKVDELKALTCNLQTHKEFSDTNVNNIYERNQQTSPQENNTESIMPCMPTNPLIVPTSSAAAATTTQLSSPEFTKQWSLDNYFDSETTFKQIENDIRCDKERQNTNAILEKEKEMTYTEETDHANKNLLPTNKNSSEDNNNASSDVCTNNGNSNIDKEKEEAIKLYTSTLQPHPPPSSPSWLPRPATTLTDKNTLTLKSTTSEITKQTEEINRNTNPETNSVVAVAATRYHANATRLRGTSNNMETNPLSSFYQSQQTTQEQTNQREEIITKKEEENQIIGGNTANKLTESDEHEEMWKQTNHKNSNNNNNIFTGIKNNVCKNSANDSLYHSRSKYKIDTSHNTVVETSKTSNDENSSSSIFPPPSALRRTRELPVSKWRKISTAFSIIARQARRTNKDYKSNNNNNYIKQEQKQQDDNNINSSNDYFSQTFNFVKDDANTRMTTQQQKSETLAKRNINEESENAGKTSNNNNDFNDDGNNNKLANTNNVNKVNYFESTWFRPHREDQEAEEEQQLLTQNAQNINKNVDCDDNLQSNVNWAAHSMIRKEKMLPGSESSASHEESVSSENISLEKEDAEEEEVEKEVKAMPNFEHYSNDDSDDACSSDIDRFNYSHINRYINTEKLQKSMVNYGSHAWLPKESNTANNKYKNNNNTVFDRITGSAGNKSNANYAFSVVTDNLHCNSFNLPLDFNNEEDNSTIDMNEEFDGRDIEEMEMEENETDSSESDNDNADEYMYSAINHSRLATRCRCNSESSVDSENIESFSNNENEGGINANGNNNGRPDMAIANRPIP